MTILYRDWHNVGRGDEFRVVPLGDIHLGNAACDEKLFKNTVGRIAEDDRCWWIGMGDYCEFINRSDPRFSVTALAPWVKVAHLADLAKAQRERFLDLVAPIASKCLGLVEGNHELQIQRHYERSIYLEIVAGVKEKGGFPAEHNLVLDYAGWLLLRFYRSEDRHRVSVVKLYVHHGFAGGKLAGGKALNMQRWLWTHDADLVLFGHSHNAGTQVESVESVAGNRIVHTHRVGAFSGTFLNGAEYAIQKGYFPTPQTTVEVVLRPGAEESRERLKVISGL